jgi:hypothetical protein
VWLSVRDTVSVVNITGSGQEQKFSILGTGNNSWGFWSLHSGPTVTHEIVVIIDIGVVDELSGTSVIDIISNTVGAVSNINSLSWVTLNLSPTVSGYFNDVIGSSDTSSEVECAEVIDSIDSTVSSNVEFNHVRGSWLRIGLVPFIHFFRGKSSSLSEPKVMSFVNSPNN